MGLHEELVMAATAAREASRILAKASTNMKNQALHAMAAQLEARLPEILAANGEDLAAAKAAGISGALVDRLLLNEKRVKDMAQGLREIAALPDPVGEVDKEIVRPNGLRVGKMRVPIGVIGIVYEARPNVTADAAGLCLKSGNAVLLRGGSDAIRSNACIGEIVSEAVAKSGLPKAAVQVIQTTDRQAVTELLGLEGYIDCVIPRGGKEFLKWVAKTAKVPVIQHGDGNCHIYIDSPADYAMAEEIVFNAKVSRPGVCNAVETVLVHRDAAQQVLPALCQRLAAAKVEIRGCDQTRAFCTQAKPATEQDYATEFLDLILAIRVVDNLEAAIQHIEKYGSSHSEAIVTKDYGHAEQFLREVDAAAVLVNASTRFVDGGQFGLGAEIGISTQKLHARGPMGVRELTTEKFVVRGSGQIRI